MKRSLLLSIVGSMMACLCVAQNPEPQLLYPDGKMPGNNEIDPKNFLDNEEIRAGITVPDYTLFLPDPQKATGQCIIVCPGGGYGCVCYAREGNEVAQWLNENGIAAIVQVPDAERSSSDSDCRLCPSHENRARTCRAVGHKSSPDRCHGILCRRTSCFNGRSPDR